jgi:uncharacterized membrane-anchored protein YhcB (DUF1043 family)
MKKYILNSSIFFIGSVFGLVVGVMIGVVFVWLTIGAAVYNARADQYQYDRALFYGDIKVE